MQNRVIDVPVDRVVWDDPDRFPWDEVFREESQKPKSETPIADWAAEQDRKLIDPLVAPLLEMQQQLEATKSQVEAIARHHESTIERRSIVFCCWLLFGCCAYIYVGHPVVVGTYEKLQAAVNLVKPDSVEVAPQRCVQLSPPVGTQINSPFGMRKHPIDGQIKMHSGVDYPGYAGDPIRAAAAGKVSEVAWRGGYGLAATIDHGNGLQTFYAHLQEGSVKVKVGDAVMKGGVIAGMGTTGYSTGVHLHFETILNGKKVNPEELLNGPGIGEACPR